MAGLLSILLPKKVFEPAKYLLYKWYELEARETGGNQPKMLIILPTQS